jgi:hypothetical protein
MFADKMSIQNKSREQLMAEYASFRSSEWLHHSIVINRQKQISCTYLSGTAGLQVHQMSMAARNAAARSALRVSAVARMAAMVSSSLWKREL